MAFEITRDDGLTDAEGLVADALCDAANAFVALMSQHPSEQRDFTDAIHRCQDLLCTRIARRHYPEGWPTYAKAEDEPDASTQGDDAA